MSKLQSYLDRIGYTGTPQVNLETLSSVHRAHLLAIPYENLDIHRGGRLTLNSDDHFQKIVGDRRGGWCYEMNGLLAWALREIGFDVTMLASTVNRQPTGGNIEGNHLILLVKLDRPYLADVGFGNGFLDPLPLASGSHPQRYLDYRLRTDGERWWFENHRFAPSEYDFTLDGYRLSDFEPQSQELQTSPQSGFVKNTVCHRFISDGMITLRGVMLRTTTRIGATERAIDTLPDYQRTLEDVFDIHLSDSHLLWEKAWERHLAWVSSQGV